MKLLNWCWHHWHSTDTPDEPILYPCGAVDRVWRRLKCCKCGTEMRQVFPN